MTHSWHVTPWSWLMSQSISGHGLWSGTESPRVSAGVMITTLCRIKSWRGRHSGHSFVVWEDWNIKTRIKGLLYLRSKPRVLQRICSGWIECLHQSKVVMDGSDRVLTRDSFRLRRDFGFSAVWIQCPMSGGRKEGKKPQLCFWYPGFFLPGTLKLKRARGGCDTRTHTLPGPQRPE